jgi:hypothetical protein
MLTISNFAIWGILAVLGRARAGCHPGHQHPDNVAVAANDPRRADRVRGGRRSGRRRLRRELGVAGRQYDRVYCL